MAKDKATAVQHTKRNKLRRLRKRIGRTERGAAIIAEYAAKWGLK